MIFAVIIVILAAADLGAKWMIEKQDQENFPKPWEASGGRIWLYRNHNAGFPFGFLEKYDELVRTIPLAVTSALAGVFFYLIRRKGEYAKKTALAILLGGSVSNLYDRYVRHYVVDYFSIQWKALKKVVFNLGDVFVFVGAGLLLTIEAAKEIREGVKLIRASVKKQ